MHLLTSAALLSCHIFSALAIPPESFGFPSAPNDTALTVTYNYNGNATEVAEGVLFGPDVPAMQPSLAVNTMMYQSLADYDGAYLVIMVDPDASTPQNPSSRFILHWLQPGLSPSNMMSMGGSEQQLVNSTPAVVPYARPMPPPTSDPHRYIFYAFQQPEDFAVPPAFSSFNAENRSMFNLTDFISAANLGTPAAANFFFASNQSSVLAGFIAAPGGQYPGGNGAAVTEGPGPAATATAGSSAATTTGATATAGSSAATTTGATASASSTLASFPGNAANALASHNGGILGVMALIGGLAFYNM